MLKGLSKALICGGIVDICEVIDLESSTKTCKHLPSFPAGFEAAIGGLNFKENPIICGGFQNGARSNKCYTLEDNNWVSTASMNSATNDAAGAQLPDGKILVTGGYDGKAVLNSAEILTKAGWESTVPSLPVTIIYHCMITVNSTTVMAIGGHQDNQFSGKMFYFTFGEESWMEGPELKNKRSFHSCGRIRKDKESQEMSIIAAGGHDGSSYLSSSEILDVASNEWKTGPELPFGIHKAQMVEDPNGGVILIGGGSESIPYLDTLYQLPHGGQDAVWTKKEQKLEIARYLPKAFLVPDKTVDC